MQAHRRSGSGLHVALIRRVLCGLATVAALVSCGGDDNTSDSVGPNGGPPTLIPRVLGVEIASNPGVMHVGEQAQLVASVLTVDGAATVVGWSSSTPSVAGVSNGGLVTAVAIGTTVVTATSLFDFGKSGSTTITVGLRPAVTGVNITQPSATIAIAATVTLTAAVSAVGGASTAVTWTSSDLAIATVSPTGVVTGVAEGTVSITARSAFDATRSSTIPVTVVRP